MASVVFENATRIYPGTTKPAVDKLNLTVNDGEFLVLVGPSGCGKSTSLRMLAGLEEVDEGRILIGDRDVTNVAPKDRDIAMVFQSYALYPHMTVAENMGFALKIAGVAKEERDKRVNEAAKLLDLEPYLERKPKALSGGQRQRVAMGRAIVREPQVFLMDEPLFSASVSGGKAMLGDLAIDVPSSAGDTVTIGIRPEGFAPAAVGFKVVVEVVEELGADAFVYGRPADASVKFAHAGDEGAQVIVRWDPKNPPKPGETVTVSALPGAVHLFNSLTGERVK